MSSVRRAVGSARAGAMGSVRRAHRFRRAPRLAAVAAAAILTTAAGACSGGSSATPSPSPRPSAPTSPTTVIRPVRAIITYRVTGRAPSVDIRYGNKHHARALNTTLPWEHTGSAFTGTTVVLAATQPKSRYGYRL